MPRLHLGILCGLIFGAISIVLMSPLKFSDKRAAMLGAFFNRFAIGVCLGFVPAHQQGWGTGLALGMLLSLPDAVVTKAYFPILTIGAIGGAAIGAILSRFGT